MSFRHALAAAGLTLALGACHSQPVAPPPASTEAHPAPAAATAASAAPSSFDHAPAPGTKAKCAVSGEEFTVAEGTLTATWEGRTYVFCCPDCKPAFEKNPAKYAAR